MSSSTTMAMPPTLRPNRKSCLSRSSLDSGFESGKSLSPSSPESSATCLDFKPSSSSTISPLAVTSLNLKQHQQQLHQPSTSSIASSSTATAYPPCKKPKFDLSANILQPLSPPRPETLATKLINSCTSPKSTNDIRRLLQYCIPSTSSLPTNLKKDDLKFIISEFVGDKNGIEEEIPSNEIPLPKGSYGDCKCEWSDCEHLYETENELFDHFVEVHLIPVRPQSLQDTTKFACQWSDCDMMPTRGDAMKKYDWLESHCTFKHLPSAQPHKCIFDDCQQRFKTFGQLNSHVKNAHKEASPESAKPKPKKTKPDLACFAPIDENETAFKWYTGKLVPAEHLEDNIDRRMFDWLHEVQAECIKMEKPCLQLEASEDYKELKGSKRKKAHCKNYLKLVDGAVMSPIKKQKTSKALPQMSTSKAQKHLKSIFSSIGKPKPKPQRENVITVNGKKFSLVKAEQQSTKPKSIDSMFKMINTEDGPIQVVDAKHHLDITKMTLGDEAIEEWIKWDDEREATEDMI